MWLLDQYTNSCESQQMYKALEKKHITYNIKNQIMLVNIQSTSCDNWSK